MIKSDNLVNLPYPLSSYWVSDAGQVFSTKRGWSEMKLLPDAKGYLNVSLMRDDGTKRSKRYRVHTLILLGFRGEAPNGYQCRHLDGNKSNNHLSNLEWGTASENQVDNVMHGVHPAAILDEGMVVKMREEYASGNSTHAEIAMKYGVTRKAACDAIGGKRWAHVPGAVAGRSNRVVTREQADEIRALYATGRFTYDQLANRFGFKTITGVYLIVKNINHK